MPKKIPQRMCVGCRAHRDKRDLIRVVRTAEREVFLDPTGKKAGRGAYVCRAAECLKKASKSRALERALGVNISPDLLARLEESLAASTTVEKMGVD